MAGSDAGANGFPVPNPTTPYWLSQPHELASYRSSSHVPEDCDIAIIGTGMAGVTTAYHILSGLNQRSRPKVVLLEARQACSGATGRNGGHTKLALSSIQQWFRDRDELSGNQMIEMQTKQIELIKAISEKENIDCDLVLTRSFDILLDEEHAKEVRDFFYEQKAKGPEWIKQTQWLEGKNLEKLTSVKGVKGAANVQAASLWPYKFVTSLLAVVLDMGALLYTETAVQSVKQDTSGDNVIATSRGVMRAEKIVFATNAYTSALLPQYKDVITPRKGQNSHLVAESPSHHGISLTPTYNLYYDAGTADYLVPRPDGAIILGGGSPYFPSDRSTYWNTVDDSTLVSDEVTGHFNRTMGRYFRGWENSEAKADYVWSGIMGTTPDGLPHVGLVPETSNQFLLAGFNGGGMTMIPSLSQGIAKMVSKGVSYEDADLPSTLKTTAERLKVKNKV